MKLGYFGGMANNMYVFAKNLNIPGVFPTFIRDFSDNYIMSQPYWEDCFFTVRTEDIPKLSTPEHHLANELRFQWESCVDYFADQNDAATLRKLREMDYLIVCGLAAEKLAYASGVPYIIWPHGGDIRLALQSSYFKGNSVRQIYSNLKETVRIKRAFKRARSIATHDPTGVFGDVFKRKKIPKLDHLPIPLPFSRKSRKEVLEARSQVEKTFGIKLDSEKLVVFIPSRLDFFWKGHDLFFNAARKYSNCIQFICCGWGADLEKVRKSYSFENFSLLETIASKPHMFDLYRASDLVVDQFRFGTYGTSAVEAISCSTPVMMYINENSFQTQNWPPPLSLTVKQKKT